MKASGVVGFPSPPSTPFPPFEQKESVVDITSVYQPPIIAKRFLGSANTGKTTTLIEELAALLEAGVPANRIAVFAASPQAAAELRSRLQARVSRAEDDAAGMFVGTPRAFAMRVLDTEYAYAITGRKARMLSPIEMSCLIEDLKVSGIREGRIRKMLAFFFRSQTELADDEPRWLVGAEEDNLYSLLEGNLDLLKAVTESELSNLACKVVLQAKAADGSTALGVEGKGSAPFLGFDYVFVDDYQLLSRASQHLCCLLSHKSVSIAANPNGCVQVYESYPYAAGVEEFVELFPCAQTIELSVGRQALTIQKAISALSAEEHVGSLPLQTDECAFEGSVGSVVSSSPEEEFQTIAQFVAETLGSGITQDVVVAAPNISWAASITSALHAVGVDARCNTGTRPWNANVTSEANSLLPRLLCALRLVTDPEDFPAWRTWCGFGDSMANSAAFAGIRHAAAERGLSMVEALDLLSSGLLSLKKGSLGADRVVEAYREGLAMCEGARGRRGMELLDFITACVQHDGQAKAPSAFAKLCGSDEPMTREKASASDLLASAMQSFEGPRPHGKGTVAVLTYRETIVVKADTLVIAGFVNGFIPKGDWFDLTKTPIAKQPGLRAEDARLVTALMSAAQRSLVFSAFDSIDLETALRLRLKIDRIRMEKGRRMASISPSIFLQSALGTQESQA